MTAGSGSSTGPSPSKLPVHATIPVIFGVAFATGFSGAVVPGSLLAVVVRETMRFGWPAGPVMMIGHSLLELIAIILLVTGIIRIARSPVIRGMIGVVGAAVLLYFAHQTLIISGETGVEALRQEAHGWLGLIWLGALMSMANPYWWLWWATIGMAHSHWALGRGRLGAGTYFTGHILSDILWYSAVSIALGTGRNLLSPDVMRVIYLGCAGFLIVLGIIFGVAGFRTLRRWRHRSS